MNSKSPERVRGRKVAALIRDVAKYDVYAPGDHMAYLQWSSGSRTSFRDAYTCCALAGHLPWDGNGRERREHALRKRALRHYRKVMGWSRWDTLPFHDKGIPLDREQVYTARMVAMELAALVAEQEGVS